MDLPFWHISAFSGTAPTPKSPVHVHPGAGACSGKLSNGPRSPPPIAPSHEAGKRPVSARGEGGPGLPVPE